MWIVARGGPVGGNGISGCCAAWTPDLPRPLASVVRGYEKSGLWWVACSSWWARQRQRNHGFAYGMDPESSSRRAPGSRSQIAHSPGVMLSFEKRKFNRVPGQAGEARASRGPCRVIAPRLRLQLLSPSMPRPESTVEFAAPSADRACQLTARFAATKFWLRTQHGPRISATFGCLVRGYEQSGKQEVGCGM